MAGWAVALVAVSQVAYWLTTRLATTVSERAARAGIGHGVGYTAYANAQLLWIVPHGIVTVSLATMLMPRVSGAAAEGGTARVRAYVSRGLRVNAAAIVPCAFFFLALGPQITAVVFQHGTTSAADTRAMGWMLCAFAPGLVAYSAQYLVQRGLYALQDARTPFWGNVAMAVAGSALTVGAYALLSPRWAVTAMAGAYSLAQVVGLLWMAVALRRRLGGLGSAAVVRAHAALGVVSGIAGAASWALAGFGGRELGEGPLAAGLVLAGGAVVFAVCVLPVALPLARSRGRPRVPARGRRRSSGRSRRRGGTRRAG
jgi:putative peptidoglycan lipid II flippase